MTIRISLQKETYIENIKEQSSVSISKTSLLDTTTSKFFVLNVFASIPNSLDANNCLLRDIYCYILQKSLNDLFTVLSNFINNRKIFQIVFH